MKKRKQTKQDAKPRIAFQFSHEEVLAKDLTRFLALFDEANIPQGEALKLMQGKLYIVIDGYDDDPRSLPDIPEARLLFQSLFDRFPYWFFFLVPETLPTMAVCLFKEYSGVRKNATTKVAHGFSNNEMADFIKNQAAPLQKMCFMAGMNLEEFDNLYYRLCVKLLPEIGEAVPPPS